METLILCHADCDGICAGAIALSKFPNSRIFFTKPVSLVRDLSSARAERVIICDIALNRKDAREILSLMKDREILYFDHHPIPETITKRGLEKSVNLLSHEENVSASELIYRHYQKSLPKERVWLAIYGAIGDYSEDTPFVEKMIRDWDARALYFEVSSLVLGINNDPFSTYSAKRRIIRSLSMGDNPSDIPGLVKSAKEVVNKEFDLYELVKRKAKTLGKISYVKDLHTFGFRGASALFAATVKDKPIGLSIYTRDRYIDITMRSRDYRIPLNKLAEYAGERVGGSGGGLPVAAGARIPLGKLGMFIKEMNRILS